MRAVVHASVFILSACGQKASSQVDATTGGDAATTDGARADGTTTDDAAPNDAAPLDALLGDAPIAVDGMMPAQQILRINEVNANATNCDLVELRAIAGGDLTGLRIVERKDIVFTFPAMTVAPDALIVIHFGAGTNGPCSNGVSGDETTSPTEHPHAMFPNNYDGAYDLFTTDAGLTATDNVISVMRTTTVIDAVLLSDAPTGTAAGPSEEQAAIVAAQGQWQMVGGGIPTGGFVGDNFNGNAALDLSLGGATPAGASIQRLDNTDDNDKADWNTGTTTVQPSTWGALNVGQSPL
jgi:hypothetical protein